MEIIKRKNQLKVKLKICLIFKYYFPYNAIILPLFTPYLNDLL